MSTVASQIQNLLKGAVTSTKDVADNSRNTSKAFETLVRTLKEADSVFTKSQFSEFLRKVGSPTQTTASLSQMANTYRRYQSEVVSSAKTAITAINDIISAVPSGAAPKIVKSLAEEVTRLVAVTQDAQGKMSTVVARSIRIKDEISKAVTSDTTVQELKSLTELASKTFNAYATRAATIVTDAKTAGIVSKAQYASIFQAAKSFKAQADQIARTPIQSVEELKKMLLELGKLQDAYHTEVSKTGVAVTQFVSQSDLVAISLAKINTSLTSLEKKPGLKAILSTQMDDFRRGKITLDGLIEKASEASKALMVSVTANRFKHVKNLMASMYEALDSMLLTRIVKVVTSQTDALQKGLDVFASSISSRFALVSQSLRAAFVGGGSISTAIQVVNTLGRLRFEGGSEELSKAAIYAIRMSEALGVSGEGAARLVFFGKQANMSFVQLGDTLATIRDNTRLTADEFQRFTEDVGTALMTMGQMVNLADTLKSTLKIDDTLRSLTGQAGDYVNFFKRISTSTEGMQMAMSLGLNTENLTSSEQQRFIQSLGTFVDRLTKEQPLLQQIAILENLSAQTGLSVISLRKMAETAALLTSRVDKAITLDERYANQLINFSRASITVKENLEKLLAAGMWPFMAAVTGITQGVAWLTTKLREMSGVFETFAVVGGVVAVGAITLFIGSIKGVAIWAPVAWAGLKALNNELMKTGPLAVANAAMQAASSARGVGTVGAVTGGFWSTLLNPLKLVFAPIIKGLTSLVTVLGGFVPILTAIAAAAALYVAYKKYTAIKTQENDGNRESNELSIKNMRDAMIRRASSTTGATTQGDTIKEQLDSLRFSIQGKPGADVSYAKLLQSREQDLRNLNRGMDSSGNKLGKPVSTRDIEDLRLKLEQHDVVLLRNAIAAKTTTLVTDGKPASTDDVEQLRRLDRLADLLQQQIELTKRQITDKRLNDAENEQNAIMNTFKQQAQAAFTGY